MKAARKALPAGRDADAPMRCVRGFCMDARRCKHIRGRVAGAGNSGITRDAEFARAGTLIYPMVRTAVLLSSGLGAMAVSRNFQDMRLWRGGRLVPWNFPLLMLGGED